MPGDACRNSAMFSCRLFSLLALTVFHTFVSAGPQSRSPGKAGGCGRCPALPSELAAANLCYSQH